MGAKDCKQYFEDQQVMIQSWRRELHQIPELGYQEFKTAAFIEARLQEMDISYEAGIGKTGIIARVGPDTGRTFALRADMDGLPITEENELPHRSTHAGLMHACGHDTHVAMLLGAAGYLKSIEQQLPGRVLLVFQPAEECGDENGLSGAHFILESGYLDAVEAIFGIHIMSSLTAGKFSMRPGAVMASGDIYEATIKGVGGHDGWPHQTTDPIYITSQVLNAIYAIRGRKIDPMRSGTISVGMLTAGTAPNVIPEKVFISGGIRTFGAEEREIFVQGLQNAMKIAEALGGSAELQVLHHLPEVQNDALWSACLQDTCARLYGAESIEEVMPVMGVEDFAWYSHRFPAVFVFLGGSLPGDIRAHHSPNFDIDDSILYRGSALMVQAVLDGFAAGKVD